MPYNKKEMLQTILHQKDMLEKAVFTDLSDLHIDAWKTSEPVTYENRKAGTHETVKTGDTWGELWDCAWMLFTGKVPEFEKNSQSEVVLLIDLNGEACVFDDNGCPLQGLTTVSSEFDLTLGRPGKKVYSFPEPLNAGDTVSVWADAACNDLFGKYPNHGTVSEAKIALRRLDIENLYYDFVFLTDFLSCYPQETARYNSVLFALYEACLQLFDYSANNVESAGAILSKQLNMKGGDYPLKISAVGHAHIDLAWLWPLRETRRKGARTFSTALKMMEKYPDYVFGASQPQLYQWVKEDYPALYRKIRPMVEKGRWECQGAMWVEADTNLTGGEALIRQILYGKAFFKKEFGVDINLVWLPDVFGYSAALPQLMAKSGVRYFMTSKLAYGKVNKFPHHTFLWQGIDGSRVLAHMPPEGTYNSSAAPRAVVKSEKSYMDKGVSENALMLFGIGDGGGGPGKEHLEMLRREKNFSGLAPVEQEPAESFFKKLEKGIDRYQVWSGELYFENHQGTYTSQSRNKRFNRKTEIALRQVELVSSQAMLLCGFGYPTEKLESIWKEMLLYQFHDILPGSSIRRVYDETNVRYTRILSDIGEIVSAARESLGANVDTGAAKHPALVCNPLSWERTEWISTASGSKKVTVPALGYAVVDMDQKPDPKTELAPLSSATDTIESESFRIVFDGSGAIRSIWDKENDCEVISEGTLANLLKIYRDDGNAWDYEGCGDMPAESFQIVESKIVQDGPQIKCIQQYAYHESLLKQEIILTAGSRRIDFVTEVEWKETHKNLRTSFPVCVKADSVVCDIQFGSIRRPTGRNTSWDMAKDEICAHKYVDISSEDYGVALLNDCKYGYRVRENTLDLSLLRSTTLPGEKADIGHHQFTYSLYPHSGNEAVANVKKRAYELNMPLAVSDISCHEGTLPGQFSLLSLDSENVIVESVKRAEEGNDLIVRMYECHGRSAKTKLHFFCNPRTVVPVDLMENPINENRLDRDTMELMFRPYEIHTLRVSF